MRVLEHVAGGSADTAAPGVLFFDFLVKLVHGPHGTGFLRELFKLVVEFGEVIIVEVFQDDILVARAFGGADKLVELKLNGLAVAVLGVLYEKHHQERHDGRAGINNKLPGI